MPSSRPSRRPSGTGRKTQRADRTAASAVAQTAKRPVGVYVSRHLCPGSHADRLIEAWPIA